MVICASSFAGPAFAGEGEGCEKKCEKSSSADCCKDKEAKQTKKEKKEKKAKKTEESSESKPAESK